MSCINSRLDRIRRRIEVLTRAIAYPASTALVPLPAIASGAVILTPASYANWAALLVAYPSALDYLLTPGDYSGWGPLSLANRHGTADRPRTIRYYDPRNRAPAHPARRQLEARIDAVSFSANSSYWHLHGLTQRAPTSDNDVRDGANHITWDTLLHEDSERTYGIRIRSIGGDVTVQRCVIRNAIYPAFTDTVGVQVFAQAGPTPRSKILDCEIYDWGDAIQVSDNATDSATEADFLIDGCDLYITPRRYLGDGLADAENGIDLKAGSTSVRSIIRNTRIWGFRRNGVSATGDAIVIHRSSRNTLIEDCQISDVPCGIIESAWVAPTPNSTKRNIVVRRTQFHGVRAYHVDDRGACAQIINNMRFEDCSFARSDYAFTDRANFGGGGGPSFARNTRVSTGLRHPDSHNASPYTEADNLDTDSSLYLIAYQRRRWTGPDLVLGARLSGNGCYTG